MTIMENGFQKDVLAVSTEVCALADAWLDARLRGATITGWGSTALTERLDRIEEATRESPYRRVLP